VFNQEAIASHNVKRERAAELFIYTKKFNHSLSSFEREQKLLESAPTNGFQGGAPAATHKR